MVGRIDPLYSAVKYLRLKALATTRKPIRMLSRVDFLTGVGMESKDQDDAER
jgi:hypothetical protein